MKNLLRYGSIIIAIVLLILLLTPFLFKEKIQQLVINTVNENIRGSFAVDNIGLSFISRFPNAHVYLEDFSLTGVEEFKRDTLIQGDRLDLIVNVFSVWGKEGISIKKIVAKHPKVHAIILEDGKANWDIALEDTTQTNTSGETGSYKLNLNSYEVVNAEIVYEDGLTPMTLEVEELDHKGSGAFTEVEYDLKTQTHAGHVTVDYQGIEYLSDVLIDANVDMHINTAEDLLVELMDNVIRVNDLGINVDGTTSIGEENIGLALNFSATEASSVKSIFSLIPGAYTQDFDQVSTDGSLQFNGSVTGDYSEEKLPGFNITLQIDNGEVQYPDLPKAISDINLSMDIQNPDGDLEKTEINIATFDAKMGDDPFHATALIRGLENMFVKGEMQGEIDLGELARVIPLEGNELSGLFNVDANAEGYYNAVTGSFPEVNATMAMREGYVKSADYPEAELKDIHFNASVSDVDGTMKNAAFTMPDFGFDLGGERIVGALTVNNFDDPNYNLTASGNLDLEKLMKIYPIEDMELRGQLQVKNLSTRGKLSDVEAEKYDNLPTSGEVSIQDLYYASPEVLHPVSIQSGHAQFTPQRLEIDQVNGRAGNTDFNINGFLENYLGYVLMGDKELTGTWILKSDRLDVNEWMVETPSSDTLASEAPQEPYGVVPIPEGINMLIQANIGRVNYRNLTLSDLEGIVTVANEEVAMEGVAFGMLGGQISMRGNYNTQNIERPSYAMDLDINRLGFSNAVQNLVIVDKFAPVARLIEGFFNTQFSMKGTLNENMYPVLEEISSEGIFEIIEGKLANLPLMNKIAEKTKLQNITDLTLDQLKGQFNIQNGSVYLKPIRLNKNDIQLVLAGSQNISGGMDYNVQLDMPKGKAGQAVFTALSDVVGNSLAEQDSISLLLNVGGTVKNPQITGIQSKNVENVKDQLVNQLEDKLQGKVGADVELNKDSIGAVVDKATQTGKDTLVSIIDEKKKRAQDSLSNLVDEQTEDIKGEIDKALEEKIGKEGKDKLNELKNKFGLPIKKKKENNDN